MKTLETKAVPYQVDALCDECNNIMLRKADWMTEFVSTNKIRHACTSCGHEELLDKAYSEIVYRKVSGLMTNDLFAQQPWRATNFDKT